MPMGSRVIASLLARSRSMTRLLPTSLILPGFSNLDHPVNGGNVIDNRFDWSFVRLLTPTGAFEIDSGWIHRNWPTAQTSGLDTTDVGIKTEIFLTISTRRWSRRGWRGVLGDPGRPVSALTDPTRSSRAYSSEKALVIYPTPLHGCAPSQ